MTKPKETTALGFAVNYSDSWTGAEIKQYISIDSLCARCNYLMRDGLKLTCLRHWDYKHAAPGKIASTMPLEYSTIITACQWFKTEIDPLAAAYASIGLEI
jgi:hypothetical protein